MNLMSPLSESDESGEWMNFESKFLIPKQFNNGRCQWPCHQMIASINNVVNNLVNIVY